ncbi:MAG TPA: nuclear transport factor 2 family protein [Terriglobales bacterium]|nr:nuclear transport factor 2 family protein [Terriglobales bacterium]
MTPAERAILALERTQVSDFNRHKIAALVAQYSPSFVGFSSTRHPRISGRNALARTFRHYLKVSPRVRYGITQPKVQVLGDAAVASFYWKVRLAPGHSIEGRGSHVFAKHGGSWKIVHEHFSRSH